MENKNNMLPDEMLAQVSGGVSTNGLKKVYGWYLACDDYECKLCGMHGKYIADHKGGCAVKGIQNPGMGWGDQGLKEINGCWSCKHVVHGNNYPADLDDLYCGRG